MNRALTNKILTTLAFLFAYRVLTYMPVPDVNVDVTAEFFNHNENNALGLFSVFSGGAAERFSIISLGIMSYITASIIMELLAATFSNIGKTKKERGGMRKHMRITRYAAIVITLVQSTGVAIDLQSLHGRGGSSVIMVEGLNTFIALCAISMLAGTMLLMWLGEQITQKGIGNGTSLIIFTGIVSTIPSAVSDSVEQINSGEMNFLTAFMILLLTLLTIGVIIYVELGECRIPISYSRKVVMQNQDKHIMSCIPIKVNLSGVIPPISASAILMFPATILQTSTNLYILAVNGFLNPNSYTFHVLTFLFMVLFAYFYASIVFNAKDTAEDLKKQEGFTPGIRLGKGTTLYLNEVASRLTLSGSIYLALVATLSWVLVKFMGVPFNFGGTFVPIVV